MKIKDGVLLYVSRKDIEDGRFAIPYGVTCIGSYAFSDCVSLKYVTIPDSVSIIGSGAFFGCTSLRRITIPKSVTRIGDYAFCGCPKLTYIIVSKRNKVYHSSGNCLIETATKTLIFGHKNSIIPVDGSVGIIGTGAFCGCVGLTSIAIPDSVTSIGDRAFFSCNALTSITIPKSVTNIGCYTFCGCGNLTSVTIPDSVTRIEDYAFSDCASLTSIAIPDDSTISIGCSVFLNCISLIKKGKFKATDENMRCRGFQYELGKQYHEDKAILCESGFHYCENAFDLFNYYYGEIGKDIRFFKVETSGLSNEVGDDSKRVCKDITLMEEIKSYKDLLN